MRMGLGTHLPQYSIPYLLKILLAKDRSKIQNLNPQSTQSLFLIRGTTVQTVID